MRLIGEGCRAADEHAYQIGNLARFDPLDTAHNALMSVVLFAAGGRWNVPRVAEGMVTASAGLFILGPMEF